MNFFKKIFFFKGTKYHVNSFVTYELIDKVAYILFPNLERSLTVIYIMKFGAFKLKIMDFIQIICGRKSEIEYIRYESHIVIGEGNFSKK